MPLSFLRSYPLLFERNEGQAPSDTVFLARGEGYTLLFEKDSLQINLRNSRNVQMELVDALAGSIVGRELRPTKTNYYIGNDPSHWHTNIQNFGSVAYVGVYRGIELIYHGNGSQLEYDFVVSPHADPSEVRMRFPNQKLKLRDEGVDFEGVDGFTLKALKAYQLIEGKRRMVSASWQIKGDEASILLGSYDQGRELIIDPVFFYGTYIGGSANDDAVSIVPAAEPGYYYVALSSSSLVITQPAQASGSPSQNPNNTGTDALILGIDATNAPPPPSPLPPFTGSGSATPSLVINSVTYLGGSSGTTKATSMVSDQNSNLYITGTTDNGTAFPTSGTQPCSQSCSGFVAKLGASINTTTHTATITSKYSFGLPAIPQAIAVDSLGDAFLTGSAYSTAGKQRLTIPSADSAFQSVAAASIGTGGNLHAFLLQLDPSGATAFCSYIGGSGTDSGNALTIAGDSVFVAGVTSSTDFPSTSGSYQSSNRGGQDGFLLGASKLSSSPNLAFSTYLGGAGSDTIASIVVGPTGNLVITGSTTSSNFPTQPSPAFLKLYWPVKNNQDNNGNQVPQLPTAAPTIINLPTSVANGVQGAFVTSLSADGTRLLFTDFLAGVDPASVAVGQAVQVDDVGVIYVTGSYKGTNGTFLAQPSTDPQPVVGDTGPFSFNVQPTEPYQNVIFAEIDPTGRYLLEATIAGGYGVDQAKGLVISGPLAAGGAASIVGTTTPDPNPVDGTNSPNLFLDASISAVGSIDPPLPTKDAVADTTGFFVQEALAGYCAMQLTGQAGSLLTFKGPCISGTQSGVLYANPESPLDAGKKFSAPIAVTPSGDTLVGTVTVDVGVFKGGTADFTFAFLPLGAIGGVGSCTNQGTSLNGCGIVTAGGGAGTLFKVTSGQLAVSLACTGANCNYNATPNTVLVGQPVTLTAAVTNALPPTVTWSSSQGVFSGPNPAVSIQFTPSGAGGAVLIQASPVADPTLKASEITLNTIGGTGGTGALTILSSTSKMVGGTTFQFTANQAVTWTATAGTISSAGEFTAPNPPPSPATVIITATSQSGASASVSTQVSIFNPPTLTFPASNTLHAGGSVSIPITVTAGTGIPNEALLFSCAPASLPTGVSCSFTPNPVTNTGNVQLTLNLSSTIVGSSLRVPGSRWNSLLSGKSGIILGALFLWARRRKGIFARAAITLTVSLGVMLLSSCGTGGSFGKTSGQGHLTGAFTLNIVVSGASPQAADLNQTVAIAPLSFTLQ